MDDFLHSQTPELGISEGSHQRFPANWDAWDIANHQRWRKEYLRAQASPGSAEYLAALLAGPESSCPHPTKLKAGREYGIPKRLGLFQMTDKATSFVDTEKLCLSCYKSAVPEGFNVWSTWYKDKVTQQGKTQSEFYPPMYEAGFEGFERFTEILDGPAANASAEKKVRSPCTVLMPQNAEAREAWRFIQEERKPFYIDQLHLTAPWNPNAINQQQEDLRVSRENAAAYIGCSQGILATGIGGAGPNSAAEQRILADRGINLPANFGEGACGQASFEPDADDQLTAHQLYAGKVLEFPETWPENYKMPEEGRIDDTEREMRGFITGPTADEFVRRRGFPEPDEQEGSGFDMTNSGYQGSEPHGWTRYPEQSASVGDVRGSQHVRLLTHGGILRYIHHENFKSQGDERFDHEGDTVDDEADNGDENPEKWYESRSDHPWAEHESAGENQDEDVRHERDNNISDSEGEEDQLVYEAYKFNRGLFGERESLESENEYETNVVERAVFSNSQVDSDEIRRQGGQSTSESVSGVDDESSSGYAVSGDGDVYQDADERTADDVDESSEASDEVGRSFEYDDTSSDESGNDNDGGEAGTLDDGEEEEENQSEHAIDEDESESENEGNESDNGGEADDDQDINSDGDW